MYSTVTGTEALDPHLHNPCRLVNSPSRNKSISINAMSRFISGGLLDQPIERDEEWAKAEREVEEERKRKAELDKQHAGKSLYEVLQANKGE
jgi:hypothetical protein